MDLIRNLKENEFDEMEGEVYFEYLNKYIHLIYVKDIDYTYVKKVANYLNKIDEKIMNKLVEYSIKYCNDMISNYPDVEYKKGLCNLKNPIDILNYLEVNRLKIDEFSDENSNVLNLSGSCEWDRENGFQWLIRDDKILYVGAWDDLNIWLSPLDDKWSNYVL